MSDIDKSQEDVNACIVKSPIDGIVSQVAVSPNENIPEKSPLVKIYNPSTQAILLTLSPKDLPIISKDKEFEVRVSAYPFNKYGSLSAEIATISPLTTDLVDDNSGSTQSIPDSQKGNSFLAKANIKGFFQTSNSGLPQPVLKDGMPVVALFTSREKRLIYIFSDQFMKIQDSIKKMRSRF